MMTSELAMPSLRGSPPDPNYSAPQRLWSILAMPMAPCGWLKNCAAPGVRPSMSLSSSSRTESDAIGNDDLGKGKNLLLCLLPFTFCLFPWMFGGQGRNRTADAGLFRAALYQLSYLARSAARPRSIGTWPH